MIETIVSVVLVFLIISLIGGIWYILQTDKEETPNPDKTPEEILRDLGDEIFGKRD